MHTPFAGMVRAAHRKMMRDFAKGADVDEDFERRLAPALQYPSRVGNLCSGSVYLALASVIENADVDDGARIGLYSYGSGCSSEFFSGVADRTSRETLATHGIGAGLDARVEVPFDDYVELLAKSKDCLVPERNRTMDPDEYTRWYDDYGAARDLLVWTGTKDYHRTYDWIAPRSEREGGTA